MKIGVFFGGKSPEHDISIITGQLVLGGLKRAGYDACGIYVGPDGSWHMGTELESIAFFKKPGDLKRFGRIELDLERSRGKMVFRKKGILGKEAAIDFAFPCFHGRNGEDGTMQGLFELMGIPYAGCGVAASAIAMDKVLTKQLYEQAGFPTAKFIYFYRSDWERKKSDYMKKIETGLAWPLFVKPARLGSSIGIARVKNAAELVQAIDVAFHYDEKVLVEEGVPNAMDVTCAVMGHETVRSSLLQECIMTEGFFSYEDKYLTGGGAQFGRGNANFEIPARLDEATTAMIRNIAEQVFVKFECSGIARVDFLCDTETKKVYVNEINALPGTLYHHLWEKSGVPLAELLKGIVAAGMRRHEEAGSITSSFSSGVLTHADWSAKLGKR